MKFTSFGGVLPLSLQADTTDFSTSISNLICRGYFLFFSFFPIELT